MDREQFDKFYPKIYNYVYYRILSREDAEDVTGDVFYKALAGEASFDPRRASYCTWLFTIAHNCVANFFRSKKETESLDALDEAAEADGPDAYGALDALIDAEDLKRLHLILAKLSEREREILALRFWGELSYKDIAGQTGLSVKNVSVILTRAVTKLRKLWDAASNAE